MKKLFILAAIALGSCSQVTSDADNIHMAGKAIEEWEVVKKEVDAVQDKIVAIDGNALAEVEPTIAGWQFKEVYRLSSFNDRRKYDLIEKYNSLSIRLKSQENVAMGFINELKGRTRDSLALTFTARMAPPPAPSVTAIN